MGSLKFVQAVVVALTLVGCSKPGRYKVIDVPYCDAPRTGRSGFHERMRYLYRAGNSTGQGPIDGIWPSLGLGTQDSVERDSMLLAIVECSPTPQVGTSSVSVVSSHQRNAGLELTESSVPTVCAGQRTVFHGTLHATTDTNATAMGWRGVFHFPPLPLTCEQGNVRRTTSAELQRPQ